MSPQSSTASTTTTPIVVEWAPFTVVAGTDDATVLAAADQVQTAFLTQQPGFVRRELLKGNANQWVDIIYWNSLEEAERAQRNAAASSVCSTYFALMTNADAGVLHFEHVKTYA